MRIVYPSDMELRTQKESAFFKAIRGIDETCIETVTPKVVKYLANEMSLLGEDFLHNTIKKSAVMDENGSKIGISYSCYRSCY